MSGLSPGRKGRKRERDHEIEENEQGVGAEENAVDETEQIADENIEEEHRTEENAEEEGPTAALSHPTGAVKATAYYDASTLEKVALSSVLMAWNVQHLGMNRFLAPDTYKSNIAKLKKLVKYTKQVVDATTREGLKAQAPNQVVQPDQWTAWKETLKSTCENAEKQVMDALLALEIANPEIKPAAKAAPLGKPNKKARKETKKVAPLTNFVYALEKRLSQLIKRKLVKL